MHDIYIGQKIEKNYSKHIYVHNIYVSELFGYFT
jgi:hypothetical protein